MTIVRNAPRRHRSFLRLTVGLHGRKLFLLSPKQSGDSKGQWRYAISDGDDLVLVGKGVTSRDFGREVAVERFGVKASEIKAKKDTSAKAA